MKTPMSPPLLPRRHDVVNGLGRKFVSGNHSKVFDLEIVDNLLQVRPESAFVTCRCFMDGRLCPPTRAPIGALIQFLGDFVMLENRASATDRLPRQSRTPVCSWAS